MILLRLTGGLGNQMFQYALGTHLALKNKTELKIDTTLLQDRSRPHELVTHRELDLDVFNIPLHFADAAEIERFNGRVYKHLAGKLYNKVLWHLFRKHKLVIEQKRSFQPEICMLPDDRCLVGAWQSEKYFKSVETEIRKTFRFKEALSGKALELSKEISGCNSLCINVRRGDYVSSPLYQQTLGAMPRWYFMKGVEQILAKQQIDRIYIFSDDEAWARENLEFPTDTLFVGSEYNGPKYSFKLQLMIACRHFVIPNSSFSWWAAWLSDHSSKTVVAPLQWFKDPLMDSSDLVPESWIRI